MLIFFFCSSNTKVFSMEVKEKQEIIMLTIFVSRKKKVYSIYFTSYFKQTFTSSCVT